MIAAVIEMLKSRLDKEYSTFDGTCNPKDPDHWFKKFIDSDADIFSQSYCIDDNPFLPDSVRASLKREHKGVFYDRYILGLWTVAEGLVFPYFAEMPDRWDWKPDEENPVMFSKIIIGIDFGGNGSATRMCALGIVGGYRDLYVLDEAGMPIADRIDADGIAQTFIRFHRRVTENWGRVDYVYGDSASPTMINTLVSAARSEGINWRNITGVVKNEVEDRPVTIDRLLNTDRLHFMPKCVDTKRALASLRWDEHDPRRPEDKNLGNINDIYDAFCYTWITYTNYIDRGRIIL